MTDFVFFMYSFVIAEIDELQKTVNNLQKAVGELRTMVSTLASTANNLVKIATEVKVNQKEIASDMSRVTCQRSEGCIPASFDLPVDTVEVLERLEVACGDDRVRKSFVS